MSPSPSWCGIAEMRWLPLSQAFVASLGSRSTALERKAQEHRHDDQHPRGDEQPGASGQRRGLAAPGNQPTHRRADVGEQVGNAGRVGQDVVAVGADHGRKLLDHLEQLQRDQQQQRVDAPEQPRDQRQIGDDGVEVQAAKVDPQPRPLRQPVGVGDVGVERGPHQIDAHTHPGGSGAAVAARGRVAELVKAGRCHRQSRTRAAAARGC